MPVRLLGVEELGRFRVARLQLGGQLLAAVLREGDLLPQEPCVSFDPDGMHLYADGWRVGAGGAA